MRHGLIPAVCVCICMIGTPHAGAGRISLDPGEDLIWRLPMEQKLENTVTFSFQDVPVRDVLDFFRTHLSINIVLDPSVIDEDERLITFHAETMRAKDALKWVMTLARLDYGFRSGAMYVSTPAKARAAETRFLKIYDVRDLAASRAALGASGGSRNERGDDDDGDSGGGRRGGRWLVQLIVHMTGRENWRTVRVIGGGQDDDETTTGEDDF